MIELKTLISETIQPKEDPEDVVRNHLKFYAANNILASVYHVLGMHGEENDYLNKASQHHAAANALHKEHFSWADSGHFTDMKKDEAEKVAMGVRGYVM